MAGVYRYKILARSKYHIGPTVDMLDDNYWAAMAADEEKETKTPAFAEEPDVPNPFVDDTHSSPASDTVTRMDVEGTDGSDSEESKGDKLKPDTLDEEGKTPESGQTDVNDLDEGSQQKEVM